MGQMMREDCQFLVRQDVARTGVRVSVADIQQYGGERLTITSSRKYWAS